MVSSVSLYYALSILEGGAAGDSAELLHALLLRQPESDVSDVAPALAGVLVSPGEPDRPGPGMFKLANSVWSTNGASNHKPFVFSEQFQTNSRNHYDASVYAIDFLASGASQAVNAWANEATEGLIPKVIDDSVLKELEWVIMNAAYFEGSWGTQMRLVKKNEDYLFTALDGSRQQADTIVTRDYENRVLDREDGSVAFSLPFIGHQYSLIVYVPPEDESDLKHWLIEEAVTDMPEVVAEVLENRSRLYQLDIQLPTFAFSDEVTMLEDSDITRDLGLGPLFSDKADFTLIMDAEKSWPPKKETKVGLIKQDTRIELDEKGVKAAAVSLIGGVIKATSVAPPLPHREIIVDRPFAFAIVENRSQTLLFNGVLVRPE
jgi:serpin B